MWVWARRWKSFGDRELAVNVGNAQKATQDWAGREKRTESDRRTRVGVREEESVMRSYGLYTVVLWRCG